MDKKSNINISFKEMDRQREFMNKVRKLVGDKNPKAVVVTYGCQQNEDDSEKIKGMLSEMGYTFTDDKETADLVMFNTCSVRKGAEQRALGNVGALSHTKRRNPSLLIGMCGCMLQQERIKEEIRRKYRHVDFTFGTHSLHKFPEILFNALSGERVLILEDSRGVIAEGIPSIRDSKFKAGLSVMYGCNNFCTYCIVPYVRGRERSRNPQAVIKDAKSLIDDGVRDLTLLGQNVNSYGKDLGNGWSFPRLLSEINNIDGEFRIRFMTSHPKDASDELFEAMAGCSKVANHLHLPFQSGSNNVLKAMNRGYTREKFIERIKKIRELKPNIALTSDVIVGFPGETEEDFEETLSLVSLVEFDSLFTFVFSPREGTPAASMVNQVAENIKKERFKRLLEIQNEISRKKNDCYLNRIVTVLAEGESKNDPNMLMGRTEEGKIVHFQSVPGITGRFADMKITEVKTWSLMGEILAVK